MSYTKQLSLLLALALLLLVVVGRIRQTLIGHRNSHNPHQRKKPQPK